MRYWPRVDGMVDGDDHNARDTPDGRMRAKYGSDPSTSTVPVMYRPGYRYRGGLNDR